MAHKFNIDAVEHITSNATQVSQNLAPKIQYPVNDNNKEMWYIWADIDS